MNEQLQEALASLLSKTVSGIDAGTAFLQTELPDVIQQLLVWKAAVSGMSMIGFFALAYAIYRLNKWQMHYWNGVLEHDELLDHPEAIFNLFQIAWLIPLVHLWSIDWLQIWLAPKIYLIEYAASLTG